jgi:HAD superfamily hydrolase (TIGR01509 family)
VTAGPGEPIRTAPLRAVIFDMDGVLIDTEPVWRRVEIDVFESLGITLTEADCRETMGMRVGEVVQLRYELAPWSGPSVPEVTDRVVDGVVAHVRATGAPTDGALAAVAAVRRHGLMCAVASSSPPALITAVLDRLGITAAVDVVCSGVHDALGKPAPDIYLRTASELGVAPASCLAVEDSVHGVLSARAAGMPCVVVPDDVTTGDPRLTAATERLDSLRDLDGDGLGRLSRAYFA